MWVHKLLDLSQCLGLAGKILRVLVRQHDEAFMIVYSSKGAEIKSGFVTGIELGEANK